jgi:signal transduction histidine kinase/DNA-binding response OmpR family regulator/HAMP domain-containing protein
MRKLFNRIPLNLKLVLSAVIPLLALIYYFYITQVEKQIQITTTNNFIGRLDNSIATANLVDELQQERRFSLSFLLKRENNTNLINQRRESDNAFDELEKVSGDTFSEDYKKFTFINDLQDWRKRIDSASISANDVLLNYQLLIDRLQSKINIRTDNPVRIQTSNNKLEASSALSRMINLIAVMRLELYLNLTNNVSVSTSFSDFQKNYNLFKSYEYELLTNSDIQIINDYNTLREESGLNPTINFFDAIIETQSINNPIDAEEWWRTSAAGMDALKDMHQSILNDIQSDTLQNHQNNIEEQRSLFIALIILALFISIIIFFAIKSTTEQINKLKEEAYKIALGETGIKLPSFPNDALGRLAQSFIQIDKNNIKISKAAEEIGKNNFIDFSVRGEKDKLGHSILKMSESLKNFSASKEDEIWVQTGLSTINSVLIGRKNLDETCNSVLASLVNYLNADVGTLYLHNYTDTLELQCSYATIDDHLIPKIIRLGQNRLGTAAKNMKPIIIDHIPEDYLAIGSSVGKSQPTYLFLIPLIQNGQVEGIMEIASFTSFHKASINFVKQVAVNIASTFQNMKSRVRLQELLEETQTQTEELQTQHSELENLNTELEAQTQKLQASEEELKVQQEELLQANQELEERSNLLEDRNHLIIERNLEIQKKAEELELSTRYKSEFLANMSHELRTPLNSILLLSRLLSENGTKNLSPDQVEYAEVIQTSGKGLLSLIDEILDLSKIEAGKMTVELKSEKVDEIVSRMRSLFGEMAKEKHLDLQFSVSGSTPRFITTDRSRLEQILKNLLSNALKFTAKGYIQLRIEPNPDSLDFIEIIVKDTGIGIAPDKQEHIFGAFQQADGSTRRKYGGTGLGLAISRELARLLGGALTLKSKVGSGSEFTLTIPIDINKVSEVKKNEINYQQDAQPINPIINDEVKDDENIDTFIASVIPEEIPDDRDTIKKGDNAILIIEDDPAFAKSLLSFTRKKGYKGLVAVRGDYGVELAFKYRPQAILLDLQLPVKDGWQVMSELKENIATRHIPVHMMSSYEIKKESLRKGAIDFINKPIAFEQMNEIFLKLEKALSKGPKKVLIIEENAKHAQALAQYLDSFNVKAEIKKTIKDGVSALQSKQIDCVILDMGIPDEEGYKTLETIKDNPGLENLPIIIFTGKNLSRIEEQKIKQYADSIVVKTAHSYQRILDEVTLFLHLIEENKVADGKPKPSKKTGRFNEILEGKTVLIADDDIRNIFSLTKALESINMKVLSANDGKEALEILNTHQDEIDIILMDMMMPELDGYETTAHIRKKLNMVNLPILAVTAKAMTGDREKCIRAGASDYISKPVDIDQLISLLRVWLYN